MAGAQGTSKTTRLLALILDTADVWLAATADQKAVAVCFTRGVPRRTEATQMGCVENRERKYDRLQLSSHLFCDLHVCCITNNA